MIFATVGMQMPFDRLIRTIDEWAATRGNTDVIAQTGDTGLRPAHVDWVRFIEVPEYRDRLSACDLIVTHAGMGTILTALEFGKPMILMPRRADRRETRNDHQLATARSLQNMAGIHVAWDESELAEALDHADELARPGRIGPHASGPLIETLRTFIQGDTAPAESQADPPALQPVVRAPWFTETPGRRAA